MNIAITFRQMEATDSVKAYANEKVAKLQRFLRQPMQAEVKLGLEGRQQVVELELHSGGGHFHASESTEDMYASIDKVIDKMERQIRSTKESKKGAERASERLLPEFPDDAD